MDWSGNLRKQIAISSERYAQEHKLPYYKSLGQFPTIMFEPFDGNLRHGNFLDASYCEILGNHAWCICLDRRHPRPNALPECKRAQAKELDSGNSSSALLMNIFCHPSILISGVNTLFDRSILPEPEFEIPGNIPLSNGRYDHRSRIDMRLGNIFVEAKLTEGKYGPKDKDVVRRYKDFDKIFKVDKLRQTTTRYYSYQLIRNILAAYHYHYSFFFLCDERRPDLRGEYQTVCNAIRCETLRLRCSVILWQEMASVIPGELKIFLSEKYGIQ